jgi:hypothetical protein
VVYAGCDGTHAQWECAETDFSLAVKNKSNYAAAFYARAAVEMDLGWFTSAIDDCTHAIRINPGAPLRERLDSDLGTCCV